MRKILILIVCLTILVLSFTQSKTIAGYVFDGQSKSPLADVSISVVGHSSGGITGQENKARVYGVVSDENGKPVADLTIFIPFTSKGTTSNANGEYNLANLNPGDFDLIFRHVAYVPHTRLVKIEAGKTYRLDVNVQNNTIEFEEIIKKADQNYWTFGFEKFKEFVLGDPSGKSIYVENPDDLYFYHDGVVLNGYATAPIKIVNNYLGYDLIYFLDYFKFSEEIDLPDGTLQKAFFVFQGSARYLERKDAPQRIQKRWERNRNEEFKGSFRHFLAAVFNDLLDESGFEVKEAWLDLPDFEESQNMSPAMAYIRSLEMERFFTWNRESGKSGFLYYFPHQVYQIKDQTKDLNVIPQKKSLCFTENLLVFYKNQAKSGLGDAKVTSFSLSPDSVDKNIGAIHFNELGQYNIIGAELLWTHLGDSKKLLNTVPADYLPIEDK
ncbi:MAG: carboxypeptidase-like regulatory domain-containing protein [Bacteroidetes bacterium]|nr:carboxypeptidase-like regulatory domain-containing protein [Bacteroidota bacterium]